MQSIIFAIVAAVAIGWAWWQFSRVRQNILLGQAEAIQGPAAARWKNVLLVAFGQKKMFKRPIPAFMHLFIYVAFLFTQIELIEIFIDGLFGQHRFFSLRLGGFYTLVINTVELLSVLAFVGTVVFLARRNLLKIPRLSMPELKGWPKLDANLILIGEILLLIGIFSMNGADSVLQTRDAAHYPATGTLFISNTFGPLFFGHLDTTTLVGLERFGWWLHLLVVFAFLNYLPGSKHLHIFLAFPATFYARLRPKGEMENMPAIMHEVKSMMDPDAAFAEPPAGELEELPEFGAGDVTEMSWLNLLQAYSCTECGRCTAVCPANITGKKLSPRKILMDLRDRATEVGNNIRSGKEEYKADAAKPLTRDNYQDGKNLFDYITREEIHACTTCNACVEACPILLNPLEPILKLRRYEILTESAGPADWLPMYNAIENSGAAWSMNTDREQWVREM